MSRQLTHLYHHRPKTGSSLMPNTVHVLLCTPTYLLTLTFLSTLLLILLHHNHHSPTSTTGLKPAPPRCQTLPMSCSARPPPTCTPTSSPECDVPVPVSEKFGTRKSLETSIGKIWYQKKSQNRYRKNTGIGIKNICYRKKYWYR